MPLLFYTFTIVAFPDVKTKTRYHILYWIVYYILISLIEAGREHEYYASFASNVITLPIKIVFVVIVLRLLLRRFLLKKNIELFLAYYFPLLILFAVIIRLSDNYVVLRYIHSDWIAEPIFSPPPFLYSIIKLQFAAAFPFAIQFFHYWSFEENRSLELARKNTEAELNFLRNQFHPHFLFNALNSLYSKIITNSDEAADVVLRISSLLRFSLYEVTGNSIPLSKELDYLKDYFHLQRLRFGDAIDIGFSVYGDVGLRTIEPFLILPFVENSFKFCNPDGQSPAWVTLQVTIGDDSITVQLDNSKGAQYISGNYQGLGQSNVIRRLELLYPNRHTLKCEDGGDHYFVYLKLNLN